MLKVTVAEVQRDIIKQLGIDLNGSLTYGSAVLNFNNANPFTALGQPLVDGNAITGQFKTVSATLRAMERAGVIRTLAEPNLTAISGESANFLAGGEFPIPAGYQCDPTSRICQLAIQFKKFGVGLNFTPVVLSEGRISLKVMEGEVIITQDVFVYEMMGEDANGKLIGRHRSTGIGRPRFWERAKYFGDEKRLGAALDAAEVAGDPYKS